MKLIKFKKPGRWAHPTDARHPQQEAQDEDGNFLEVELPDAMADFIVKHGGAAFVKPTPSAADKAAQNPAQQDKQAAESGGK